ncbi:hypothetical protein SAY86_018830 [Trapa natans]|uniref:Receptor-like serine/threonine-protein kinase n=1 Tax=Trapa natans TaxID=22666 RepID=A0AAN7LRQ3_TRANT|nr:hypothetical protein SAY86_018830 [Trapa natans]
MELHLQLQFHPSLCIIIIIATAFHGVSVSATDIPLGSSLKASEQDQKWSSPNSLFSLRFIPADPAAASPSFAASITYGSVPLWSAGYGASVDAGGYLIFLRTGDLRLVNGSGSAVWGSGTAGRGVSSATIDDSGNFILKVGNVSVWSTFENPTNSILPGQNFSVGSLLRNGVYSFSLQSSGNLTLHWNSSVAYWNRGLNSSVDSDPWKNNVKGVPNLNFSVNLVSPVLRLDQTGVLSISDPKLPSPAIMAYCNDFGDSDNVLRFLKLDGDGNLRIYSSPTGSISRDTPTSVGWAAIQDQCQVFGYCGDMGICYYGDDSRPACGCPSKNFKPVDPRDQRKGCKRKVEVGDCPGNSTLLELRNTQFLGLSGGFIANASACRSKCLDNSSCVISTLMSDGTGACLLKKAAEFSSGYHALTLPGTSFIKVCFPVQPSSLIHAKNDGTSEELRFGMWLLSVIVLMTIIVGLVFQGGVWCWYSMGRRHRACYGVSSESSSRYVLLEYVSGSPIQFSYKELQQVTRGFTDILGAGPFGPVYKGVLANGTVAAVKQLKEAGRKISEREYRAEFTTICSTHHLNLVRVIGYCSERSHRLLVYEFMQKGSLDKFLFGADGERLLDWKKRFKIALGTAKGMQYLHEECQRCIIHYNLRPENILLDDDFNAKVSDFGILRLATEREPHGYLAPEWLLGLPITSKSDVYSFGVVLLEIVSGRRSFEVPMETNGRRFTSWACRELEETGDVRWIMDEKIRGRDFNFGEVKRVLQVSFCCTQDDPSRRPMMGKVVRMLEGVIEVQKPPAAAGS